MAENPNAVLARLDERTLAIQKDVTDIKVTATNRLNAHSLDIKSLRESRAKVRGILWALGVLITMIGGERILEWLGSRH